MGQVVLLAGGKVFLKPDLAHPSKLDLLHRLVEELELLQLTLLVLRQGPWVRELSLAILAVQHEAGSERRCCRSVCGGRRLGWMLFLNVVSQTCLHTNR